MVTRPLIESIASITRASWRNGVGARQGCKQAKRTIISGMGDCSLCRVGLGIHRLHWAQSPCLIAVYYAMFLPHLLFGEGIVKINQQELNFIITSVGGRIKSLGWTSKPYSIFA